MSVKFEECCYNMCQMFMYRVHIGVQSDEKKNSKKYFLRENLYKLKL